MERQEKIETIKMFAGFPEIIRKTLAAGEVLAEVKNELKETPWKNEKKINDKLRQSSDCWE